MADTVQDMETDGAKIDEALYSRQLYVLGHEAMRKMMASSVLIVGLRGLGVEIAKNVVLGGVKSVTLYDPAPATLADLSAQFFLREEDVGKRRATATAPRLAELNQYVPVAELEGDLTADAIASFGIVVVTGAPLGEATRINEACRKSGGRFILADTYGLFGGLFCDFGAAFEVVDADGEEPVSGMLTSVSQDEEGIVTMHDETRHGLSDGDHVCFTEVQGMTELNGSGSRPIEVLGPFSFSIGDTSGYGAYTSGGYMHQVKQKQSVSFLPLPQALAAPDFLVSDFAKFERPMQLHLGFQALDAYRSAHGQLPPPSDADAAAEVLTRARELPGAVESLGAAGSPEAEASERLLRNLASGARGELAPMCAIFGGIAAQEVMKAASGKFMPLKQWLYFDAEECLPDDGKEALPPAETAPRGSRYDSQAAALGWSTQEKLGSLRYLLVGAGAIGCEMLKNWAMMGIGCGEGGHVTVTDPDTIEKSNLNRQFLFRPWDVTKAKSACYSQLLCSQLFYSQPVGRDQGKVGLRRGGDRGDEPGGQGGGEAGSGGRRDRGHLRRRLLGPPLRRVQRARQRAGAAVRRPALHLLPKVAPRERHARPEGERAGRRPEAHRELRLVARPAREEHPGLHAQELSEPDRAHHPVEPRLLRGPLPAGRRGRQRLPLPARLPLQPREAAWRAQDDARGPRREPRRQADLARAVCGLVNYLAN